MSCSCFSSTICAASVNVSFRRKSRGFQNGTEAPAVHDKHLQRLHIILRFNLLVTGRTQHAAEPALTATPRHMGARTKQNNMEKAG